MSCRGRKTLLLMNKDFDYPVDNIELPKELE